MKKLMTTASTVLATAWLTAAPANAANALTLEQKQAAQPCTLVYGDNLALSNLQFEGTEVVTKDGSSVVHVVYGSNEPGYDCNDGAQKIMDVLGKQNQGSSAETPDFIVFPNR